MPIMELRDGEQLKVSSISNKDGSRTVFVIVAEGLFLADMVAELVGQGVQGHDKFPLFGEFLDAVTESAR